MIVVMAASLVASVYLHPRSYLSRLLSSRVLVYLGTISYGFYLFHPLFLDLFVKVIPARYRDLWGSYLWFVITFFAATAFSWASFHFLEKKTVLWGRRLTEARGATKSPRLADL
jgi:peptidoglycan/LPS O-acetylase OafA/YrhL